jgi:hypothetical protein
MNKTISSVLTAYRSYRAAKASNRAYRITRNLFASAGIGYLLLLSFPQPLFAHEISYKNLTVYSREPFDENIYKVLDKVESSLNASEIKNQEVRPKIFLTGSFGFYSWVSLHIGGNSFGKGFGPIPTTNVFINKSDAARDLVFRNAPEHNQRSLSGVIAHEATHLLIRKRFGYWRNVTMPAWKKEGYAEYVAGGSTLPYETGVQLWKANPKDGTGYQYFKYYMLVKYLLEHDKLSVDDLFNREIDVPSLEQRVLSSL